MKVFKNRFTAMVAAICAVLSSAGHAGVTYYYTPSPIGSISGRAFADPTQTPVYRTTTWTVYNIQPLGSSVSTPLTGWNLGDFTGNYVPTLLGSYQRGGPTTSYGGMSVEMHDFTDNVGATGPMFGSMMNTFGQPYSASTNIVGAILSYTFHPTLDNFRPFAQGPNSVLYYSLMLQVPSVYVVGNARAHIGPSFTLEDTTTGQFFWFAPWAFNQGAGTSNTYAGEDVFWDSATAAPIVGSLFQPGTNYMTKDPASAHSTTTPWNGWRWFGYSVSVAQISRVINRLNEMLAPGPGTICKDKDRADGKCKPFSTNSGDYKLGQILVDAELARPTGASDNGYMGFSTYGIWVYSTY